jgi:type IV pilus biogenesis protein CpaD/CtpE
MRFSPILPLLLAVSSALVACEHYTDSVARLNQIPFGGANDANIAAMVANPADLAHGRGQGLVDGTSAEAPVHRLLTDHAKPLLNPGGIAPGAGGGGGGGSGG